MATSGKRPAAPAAHGRPWKCQADATDRLARVGIDPQRAQAIIDTRGRCRYLADASSAPLVSQVAGERSTRFFSGNMVSVPYRNKGSQLGLFIAPVWHRYHTNTGVFLKPCGIGVIQGQLGKYINNRRHAMNTRTRPASDCQQRALGLSTAAPVSRPTSAAENGRRPAYAAARHRVPSGTRPASKQAAVIDGLSHGLSRPGFAPASSDSSLELWSTSFSLSRQPG